MTRIQIVLRLKGLNGVRGTIKNRQNPQKYEILTDDSDRIQIVLRLKGLNGVRVPLKIGKTHKSMKFLLMTQTVITRSRRHIKTYLTSPGRVSKAPKHLVEN